MNEPLTCSVILCAYADERWELLKEAVASLHHQTQPPDEIIIVIDHNPALLAHAHAQFPSAIVTDNQGTRGLSGARNSGIMLANGALVAFLDDDAVAAPDWLAQMVRLCSEPQVLGAGCAITPLWPDRPPRWFPDEFGWVVGCTYTGMPTTRAPVRNLIGCAMCVRREVFAMVGGFQSDLGRVGKHPVGGEETELCIRALQHWPSRQFIYTPEVAVQHHVSPDRTRWRYFYRRCYFEGRSKAVLTRKVGSGAGLASERSYTLRTLPRGVRRGLAAALLHGQLAGFARAWAIGAGFACTSLGYLRGRIHA